MTKYIVPARRGKACSCSFITIARAVSGFTR